MIAEIDIRGRYEDAVEGVYRSILLIALLAFVALGVSARLMFASYDRILFDAAHSSETVAPISDSCDKRLASATRTGRTRE